MKLGLATAYARSGCGWVVMATDPEAETVVAGPGMSIGWVVYGALIQGDGNAS